MNPVAVIALGNPLMGDEGVGQRVLDELRREADVRFPGVDFIDAGTGGLAAMHQMSGRAKVVFVDCAVMDVPPGEWRRFRPDDVVSRKLLAGDTLHEGDLLRTIDLARRLDAAPAEVVIIGIQPASIEPRLSLSDELQARLGEYVAAVRAELG